MACSDVPARILLIRFFWRVFAFDDLGLHLRRRVFEARRGFAALEACAASSHDHVSSAGERPSDRLVGLPTHDDGMTVRGSLEVLEVFGQVPRQRAIAPNDSVSSNGHDQRERRRRWRPLGHTGRTSRRPDLRSMGRDRIEAHEFADDPHLSDVVSLVERQKHDDSEQRLIFDGKPV